jgi:hypothetical protein
MNSIKCVACGLVNWATEEKCKRCGALLAEQEQFPPEPYSYAVEVRPFFSGGLKFLTGLLGLTFLALIVCRVLDVFGADASVAVSVIFMMLGVLLTFVTHIWLLVRIFEESIGWGLGSTFIPLVCLVAVIMFWEKTKRSFVGQLVCGGIVLVGALIAHSA